VIEGTLPLSIRDKDSGLARLEAFSDGVFAIAITLLVIEIHVPKVEHGLGAVLLTQWPMYLAYVFSFVIIGIWWANHHELFEHFASSDHLLMLLNTVHLMCICFVPFTTALVAEYVEKDAADAHIAVAVYVGTLLFASLGYKLVWHYAVRARLLKHGLTVAYINRRSLLSWVATGIYAVALVLALINVWVSLVVCLGIALYFAHPARRRVPGHPSRLESGVEATVRRG
jgi:uncharacterized membrane protein